MKRAVCQHSHHHINQYSSHFNTITVVVAVQESLFLFSIDCKIETCVAAFHILFKVFVIFMWMYNFHCYKTRGNYEQMLKQSIAQVKCKLSIENT